MAAVFKRELKSYFTSVLGFVYLAVFYFFAGLYFYLICLSVYGTSNLMYVFLNLFTIALFITPILTMRMWSEDKKQKTDQVLFTAPVSILSITLGKYFAALLVYTMAISSTLVFAVIVSIFSTLAWSTTLLSFFGLFLIGAAFIAIGMFLSSITENQLISAVLTFATGFFILMMDSIPSFFNVEIITTVFNWLSFSNHYTNFMVGILSIPDTVFYLSVAVLFIFLNVRVFEKKRWA
ncbi:MAG: ABC transporter [Clostridia bacterium]|nr:ABC transporter [Clostridia bacterium]